MSHLQIINRKQSTRLVPVASDTTTAAPHGAGMGQQTIERSGSACLVFDIKEFHHAKLPDGVQARWLPFKLRPAERSKAMRAATHRIYSSLEGTSSRSRSPTKARHTSLIGIHQRAAEAAASIRGSQSDVDATTDLAARLLNSMEAATQRRKEVLELRRGKANKDLLLHRTGGTGFASADSARRRKFLQQLRDRLAEAAPHEGCDPAGDSDGKDDENAVEASGTYPQSKLKQLVAKHGMQDWMQSLTPRTAAHAAIFRLSTSSRRLQRSWRVFRHKHKSTTQLAQAFELQGIASLSSQELDTDPDEAQTPAAAEDAASAGFVMIGGVGSIKSSSKHECFEDFAKKLQSPATIKATQALLRRLERRLSIAGATVDGAESLLRQLSPSAPRDSKLERYPVRVMLCAYMIKEHPEVVFNSVGNIEARLSAAAMHMLKAFEALLGRLLRPLPAAAGALLATASPSNSSLTNPSPLTRSIAAYTYTAPPQDTSAGGQSKTPVARALFPDACLSGRETAVEGSTCTPAVNGFAAAAQEPFGSPSSCSASPVEDQPSSSLASLLVVFDDSWLEYLDQFVVWKGRDAVSLEQELMRMAVRLERSMRLKLGRRALDSPEVVNNPDLQAMVSQVSHDHALLAERIAHLTGTAGSARLQAALAHVKQQVEAELQAAEDAASEASWETSSEAGRSRPVSVAASRTGSLVDPVSDAEALAAAQAASQTQPNQTDSVATPDNSDEQSKAPDAFGNEQMVWEMLYNPDYSLPTEDAVAAWQRAMGKEVNEEQVDADDVESMTPQQLSSMVAQRARTIAERAFWDSIVWRFKTAAQGQSLPSQLAPLLSELGVELSGLVQPAEEGQQLAEQYTEAAVFARLTSTTGQQGGGANLTALGSMLEQLAQVLLKSGGPERAAEGAEAAQQLHARMAAALTAAATPGSSPSSSPTPGNGSNPVKAIRQEEAAAAGALAEGLAAALRLLMTQLKVIKLDAANARLAGLARAMREQGAVLYLHTKLAAAWELPPLNGFSSDVDAQQAKAVVSEKLARTAAWVAETQQGLHLDLQTSLNNAGLLLDAAAATAAVTAGGLQSVELRSGVRASPTASPGRPPVPRSPGSLASSPSATAAVKPRFPVSLDTWQGVVRTGLLALISSTTPAAGPNTPEVLGFDRARLHDMQNALQQLMVTAAGLLIVQQLRQAGGLPWDVELRAQARRRLLVVLADPGMKLAHLMTELTQLAGATAVATEDRVRTMFTTIVNPDAAAFKSIRSGIINALAAHMLYGRAAMAASGSAASACANVLTRIGASALVEDVADLGQHLTSVAAVVEAVHGDVLSLLAGL